MKMCWFMVAACVALTAVPAAEVRTLCTTREDPPLAAAISPAVRASPRVDPALAPWHRPLREEAPAATSERRGRLKAPPPPPQAACSAASLAGIDGIASNVALQTQAGFFPSGRGLTYFLPTDVAAAALWGSLGLTLDQVPGAIKAGLLADAYLQRIMSSALYTFSPVGALSTAELGQEGEVPTLLEGFTLAFSEDGKSVRKSARRRAGGWPAGRAPSARAPGPPE
jgi:hypothetical protein